MARELEMTSVGTLRGALLASGLMTLILTAAPALAQPVPSVSQYPSHDATFDGGVTGHPDIVYSTVIGSRPLGLDIYQPKGKGPYPLVVYVHGGGWERGEKRLAGTFPNWPQTLASIAQRGYVVASVSYRLSGEAKFPAPIIDVKSAIVWLRAHAATYSIDPAKAVVWGASAGGQIATIVGASCNVASLPPRMLADAATHPAPKDAECVQGVIDWYGVTDFKTQDAGPPPAAEKGIFTPSGRYLGCEPANCPVALIESAAPLAYLTNKTPPHLIIHGTLDRQVPVRESIGLNDALKAKGVDAELLIISDVDHSFVAATPERGYEVNKQVMGRVNAFLDRVTGRK